MLGVFKVELKIEFLIKKLKEDSIHLDTIQ
jgi:hypothetical protein